MHADPAAKRERALMARTWNLTEEQYQRFEVAATTPPWERKAAYEMFLQGGLPEDEFLATLREADSHDSQTLRDVLGKHYDEYTLMRGHFAEAKLDVVPFEPPILEPLPR